MILPETRKGSIFRGRMGGFIWASLSKGGGVRWGQFETSWDEKWVSDELMMSTSLKEKISRFQIFRGWHTSLCLRQQEYRTTPDKNLWDTWQKNLKYPSLPPNQSKKKFKKSFPLELWGKGEIRHLGVTIFLSEVGRLCYRVEYLEFNIISTCTHCSWSMRIE